jgi:hypothetical protein
MKEPEKQMHTKMVVLGGSANAPWSACGKRITFFSGKHGDFISETKSFASDTVLVLRCPSDGEFKVRAGDFHDRLD